MSSELREGGGHFRLVGRSREDGAGRVTLLPLADVGKSARAVATGHEGDAERLHRYWTRDPEGVGKWIKARHPWRTLRRHLAQFIHDPIELDKTTAQWFKDATGMWSGERKGKNPAGPG
jgi:hypothetical protein